MKEDPEQRNNLYEQHADRIDELGKLLQTYIDQGYSVLRDSE